MPAQSWRCLIACRCRITAPVSCSQITAGSPRSDHVKTITALSLLAALTLGAPASAQDAAVSPWSKAAYSSMRLIAGATAPSGKQRVGVEITMSPGFKTYWRSPGDAGVPPVFDWSGSENVGGLDVRWPATGRTQTFKEMALDQSIAIVEGRDDYRVLPLERLRLGAAHPEEGPALQHPQSVGRKPHHRGARIATRRSPRERARVRAVHTRHRRRAHASVVRHDDGGAVARVAEG